MARAKHPLGYHAAEPPPPPAPVPASVVTPPEPERAPSGPPRRCRVDLAHSPSWTGEATDEADAIASMKRDYGITEADHPFSVHWLE